MGKSLVAYFSVGQETAKVAKMVAGVEHADMFEIVPAVPYKPRDMEWLSKTSRVTVEQKDYFCRPKMAAPLANADAYDTIFIGFPIWMFDAPKIVYTFLESINLNGRTLVPFATSGGSGRRETNNKLKEYFRDKPVKLLPLYELNGMSRQDVFDWHKRLELE